MGKDHTDTLTSVRNLAEVLDNQVKYEVAESLHQKALSTREKIFGKGHPVTLSSVNDVTRVLQKLLYSISEP